jgi:hypothetical protein
MVCLLALAAVAGGVIFVNGFNLSPTALAFMAAP